jgi:hypothetical protein
MSKKSNEPDATLRKGNLPPASKVEVVDEDKNKGLCKKIAGGNPNGNSKLRQEPEVEGGPF